MEQQSISKIKGLLLAAGKLLLVHCLCLLLLIWFESPFLLVAIFVAYLLGWLFIIYKTQQTGLLWLWVSFWFFLALLLYVPPTLSTPVGSVFLFLMVPFIIIFSPSINPIFLLLVRAFIIIMPLLCIAKVIYLARKG